jgi:outer membrane lipoprotein-sorting protein
MSVGWRRMIFGVTAMLCVCALSVVSVRSQAAQAEPEMAETVFQNILVLKGIPVDEFMDTMGMFAAATTKDCTGCHSPQVLTDDRDAFAVVTPMIQRARQMVVMMNTINRTYFGGETRVTCYTCHLATPVPEWVPNLDIQYGPPPDPNPDSLMFFAFPDDAARVDELFASYIEGLGGAEAVAGMTSLVAIGTYSGWDTSRAQVPVEIFARAPGQMTTVVERNEGNNTYVFDGTNAWFAGVDAAIPNYTLTYTGGNLSGARIDSQVLVAPSTIQATYESWQVSEDFVNDELVTILQGTKEGETPVSLMLNEAGLLVRLVRWNDTSVGPVPTQFDFSDYRDVSGVQRPFRWVKSWTNNQATFVIEEYQLNAPVDDERFERPEPVRLVGAGV